MKLFNATCTIISDWVCMWFQLLHTTFCVVDDGQWSENKTWQILAALPCKVLKIIPKILNLKVKNIDDGQGKSKNQCTPKGLKQMLTCCTEVLFQYKWLDLQSATLFKNGPQSRYFLVDFWNFQNRYFSDFLNFF